METIQKEIDIELPISAVYRQWTNFEEFPRFMEGIKEVRRTAGGQLHWRGEILGKEVGWDAVIDEQISRERISWRSLSGQPNAATVSFTELGPETTRVKLVIQYSPLGAPQLIADALGVASSRVEADLERFRTFLEGRRGQILIGQASPAF